MATTSSGPGPYSSGRTVLSVAGGLVLFLLLVPLAFLALLALVLPMDLHPGAVRWTACALLAAAGLAGDALAVRTFLDQGKGTQMPFTPTTRLVAAGPYRFVRNPILLAVSVYYLGVAALPFGWAAGFAVLLASLLGGGIYYRLFEEPQLEARFGDEYRAYRARTPFLLPWPRPAAPPEPPR